MKFSKGQRWLWRGIGLALVEIFQDVEEVDSTDAILKCKLISQSGHLYGEIEKIKEWYFTNALMSNWTYLEGQDAPI